jgi:uncharacterized lipoprotein YehR (DUF1307 family)
MKDLTKLNKATRLTVVLIALLAVFGCKDKSDYTAQVICDSGFESTTTSYAYINDSVAHWVKPNVARMHATSSDYVVRKLKLGEVCWIDKTYR